MKCKHLKNNKSFTLSEVLVTLVVIGIIAAITVPVIMANHKKTETAARLKKFYANMSNVLKLAETEWGVDSTGFNYGSGCGYTSQKEFFETYISKHLNYVKTQKLQSGNNYYDSLIDGMYSNFGAYNSELFAVYLSDGSVFFHDECPGDIVYDVNGEKGPNQYGRDMFFFFFVSGFENPAHVMIKPHFSTHDALCLDNADGSNITYTREDYKENCRNKYRAQSCSALLETDNWEFKSDYPFKL